MVDFENASSDNLKQQLLACYALAKAEIEAKYPTVADGTGTDLFLAEQREIQTLIQELMDEAGACLVPELAQRGLRDGHYAARTWRLPNGDKVVQTAWGLYAELPQHALPTEPVREEVREDDAEMAEIPF